MVGKDPRKKHFQISIAKSAIRLVGCMAFMGYGLLTGNLIVAFFAASFFVAEVLGIIEELD